MTIVRAPRIERDFTVLPNRALRDPHMSYRARGILAYILSMPDNWRTSADLLARQGREGRDAIRTAINELISHGYARRTKARNEDGTFSSELHFHDYPRYSRVDELGKMRGKTTQPTTGNPTTDNQASIEELKPRTVIDLQSVLGSDPKLCGYCYGNGWIADGFAGEPMVCPDCKGDGITRP